MFDVIGDIHGQAAKLEALLRRLGYVERWNGWTAPAGRTAVFVGDLIDRGPKQTKVLGIVRRMVDAGSAWCIMGNHEFNAIGLGTRDEVTGKYFRPRTEKNCSQHGRFLDEVGLDSALHNDWVEWFKSLPFALDLNGVRVAHGWWDDSAVQALEQARGGAGTPMSYEFISGCYGQDNAIKTARKLVTCGVEWELPVGNWIFDKEGQKHPDARLAVWRHWTDRLRDIAIVPSGSEEAVPDIEVPQGVRIPEVTGAPILFGHHWFTGEPCVETPKVACLDWSAAVDGPLVAYRWDGEGELSNAKFVAAGGSK